MRTIGLCFAALLALSGQTPAPKPLLHLVYEFGYNTKAASSGQGTGTTTVDITQAADGGVMISAADFWWNTVRPRATNTCELYPNGSVSCLQAPYAISPMQFTLFPLLGHSYFKSLGPDGKSNWSHTFKIKAAVIPGATGFAGQLDTWNCTYQLKGEGPIPNGAPLLLVVANGTLKQESGRQLQATSKQRIAFDPTKNVPAFISDVRTHIPMKSVYSNDLIELKLTKLSRP